MQQIDLLYGEWFEQNVLETVARFGGESVVPQPRVVKESEHRRKP